MASAKLMETKSGKKYYRIYVSRGRGQSPYTTRWYVPEGWSKRSIEKALNDFANDFENKCRAGEVLNRAESKKAEEERIKAEEEKRIAAEEERKKLKTLKQYGEQVFIRELAVTCSEHTRDSFQSNLNNHIYPALGGLKLNEIAPEQISAMLLSLQADKHLKVGSVLKSYTILNLLFKKAYLSRIIERNPMDFVQRPKPTKAEGKNSTVQTFTGEELAYILKCMENEPLIWQLIVRLMIDTGARRGEILGLGWHNIDMENETITIERNLCYTPQKGIYLDTPKSGKSRTMYITDPDIIPMLKEWKAYQRSQIKVFDLKQTDDYIFTQDDGVTPMHPDSPTRRFRKYADKYGIENFHPHKLRHSFASVAITNGADVASVSEKLGHADKGTTLKMYTHADMESQRRASEIFRNAIKLKQA